MEEFFIISFNGKIVSRFTGTIAECIELAVPHFIPKAKRYKITDNANTGTIVIKHSGNVLEIMPATDILASITN